MIDITRLDRFQQLAFDAAGRNGSHGVAILGNVATRDYELIQLPDGTPPDSDQCNARGLVFIGIVGMVQGRPQSQLAVPLDNEAVAILSAAYLEIVAAGMNARLETDELQRLWAKPSNEYDA